MVSTHVLYSLKRILAITDHPLKDVHHLLRTQLLSSAREMHSFHYLKNTRRGGEEGDRDETLSAESYTFQFELSPSYLLYSTTP